MLLYIYIARRYEEIYLKPLYDCNFRKKDKLDKWDRRFLDRAKLISTWSKDPSTQTGAVITKNRIVISEGYNGLPQTLALYIHGPFIAVLDVLLS